MRGELQELIEEMNVRLREIADERARINEQKKLESPKDTEREDRGDTPQLEGKTREQLRQELENQLRSLEAGNPSDNEN